MREFTCMYTYNTVFHLHNMYICKMSIYVGVIYVHTYIINREIHTLQRIIIIFIALDQSIT